jgi:hypothetical protein
VLKFENYSVPSRNKHFSFLSSGRAGSPFYPTVIDSGFGFFRGDSASTISEITVSGFSPITSGTYKLYGVK